MSRPKLTKRIDAEQLLPLGRHGSGGKDQRDWIDFYNKQEGEAKGKRMITAPDLYRVGKDGSKELISSLWSDFFSNLISGTTVLYNEYTHSGKVVHNYNSKITKPIEIDVKRIPYYDHGIDIRYAVEKGEEEYSGTGLEYAQALFMTKDGPRTIIKTLEALCHCQIGAKNIRLMTNTDFRRSPSAVRFDYSPVVLNIVSGVDDCHTGCSRGVLLNSEERKFFADSQKPKSFIQKVLNSVSF